MGVDLGHHSVHLRDLRRSEEAVPSGHPRVQSPRRTINTLLPQFRGVKLDGPAPSRCASCAPRSTSTIAVCGSTRSRKTKEAATSRWGDSRLRLVHLQELLLNELGQAGHHPLPRLFAAHVHLGVVCVANQPVTTPVKLAIELSSTPAPQATAVADRLAVRPARSRSETPSGSTTLASSIRPISTKQPPIPVAQRAGPSAAGEIRSRISPDQSTT